MKRSGARAGLVLAAVTVAVGVWLTGALRATVAPHLPTPKLTLGAYAAPRTVADGARWQAFLRRSDTTAVNAVVLDLVTPAGVHYRSGNALARTIAAPSTYDLATRVADAHAHHLFVIGRLVLARNPRLVRERPAWAIRAPHGRRWTDAAGRSAIDVTNEDACEFAARIAREAARAGVDEVMLDGLEVPPADGRARVLAATRHGRGARAAVTECARTVAQAVQRAQARLGIAVPARLCTDVTGAGVNGQRWEDLALVADRLSPELYPDAIAAPGSRRRMSAQPYQAVSAVVALCYTRNLRLIRALNGRPVRVARIEPWLQAYSARGVSYGPRLLGEELRALRDHGVGNALLWNGASDYDRFVPVLRQAMAGRVVAYNPTPAQWARASRAPRPADD